MLDKRNSDTVIWFSIRLYAVYNLYIQYTTQNLAGTYMLITARPVVLAGCSLCLTMPVCFRKILWKKESHRTLISWLAAASVAPVRRQKSLRPVKKLGRYIYANYSSPSSASGPLSVSYDTCLFWEEVVKKIKPLGHNQLIGGSFRGVGTEAKVTCVPAEPGRVNAEEDPGGDRE